MTEVRKKLAEASLKLAEERKKLTEEPEKLAEASKKLAEEPIKLTAVSKKLAEEQKKLTEARKKLAEASKKRLATAFPCFNAYYWCSAMKLKSLVINFSVLKANKEYFGEVKYNLGVFFEAKASLFRVK